MSKFNVGDRVVLVRPSVLDRAFHMCEGMEGTVVGGSSGPDEVLVLTGDGRTIDFTPDQLEHAPQEAHQERRERIATAVLAGFATVPNAFADTTVQAIRSVEWADALIKELDK